MIGKLDRMNHSKKAWRREEKARRRERARRVSLTAAQVARRDRVDPRSKVMRRKVAAVEQQAAAPASGVPLVELHENSCRWPLWGNERWPAYFFCGVWAAGIAVRMPYCPKHTAMSLSGR